MTAIEPFEDFGDLDGIAAQLEAGTALPGASR